MTVDRLTALDTSFLRAEQPARPLHVGAVSTFEGGPLTDEHGRVRLALVRSAVEARLHLVPRLRQVVREVPLWLGRPVWADDPHFDLAHHVRSIHVPPPGDDRQLLALAADLHEEPLDRARPLWELWVVEGLSGGRVGLVEKMHHAMVDGVSGVDVSTAALDLEPGAPLGEPPPAPPATPVGTVGLMTDAVRESVERLARLPQAAGGIVRGVRRVVGDIVRMEEEGLAAPRTTLNGSVGSERRLVPLALDLEDLRRTGRAYDAKVNDVVLAAVAGGARALLAGRGEPVDRPLKVLVPVSLRPPEQSMALGNQVGALIAPLHVDIVDPVARLVATTAWTHRAKRSRSASTVADLLAAFDAVPPLLVSLASRLVVGRQPFVNLVVTNVPGPPVPVYLRGARMLDAVPIVPLGGNLTVGIAVLSYDGRLTLGFNGDPEACPDLDLFVAATAAAFDEMTSEVTAGRP